MSKKIIFIAGSYGVGKTTLCNQISKVMKIPSYSASDLISKQNNEQYGENKYVMDSKANQDILVNQVSKIQDNVFIVNGHFCLKAPNNNLILLDHTIFLQMNLSSIILLNADDNAIIHNIYNRDHRKYDSEFVKNLLESERRQAEDVSKKYNIPLYIYDMKYDGEDFDRILLVIKHIIRKKV